MIAKPLTARWVNMAGVAVLPLLAGTCLPSQGASDTELWLRESCTIEGSVVPECITHLMESLEHTDKYMSDAAIVRANDALWERRKQVEQLKCTRSGLTIGDAKIGMTELDMRYCGWGRPQSMRRFTTAKGITDYWHYADGSSLVFKNLVLVQIESS